MNRAQLIRAIINYANITPDLYLDRFNSDRIYRNYISRVTGIEKQYTVKGCRPGVTDIGGTLRLSDGKGLSIYIKCQLNGELLQPEHEQFREKVTRLGAVWLLAFSVDDVKNALKEIRKQ